MGSWNLIRPGRPLPAGKRTGLSEPQFPPLRNGGATDPKSQISRHPRHRTGRPVAASSAPPTAALPVPGCPGATAQQRAKRPRAPPGRPAPEVCWPEPGAAAGRQGLQWQPRAGFGEPASLWDTLPSSLRPAWSSRLLVLHPELLLGAARSFHCDWVSGPAGCRKCRRARIGRESQSAGPGLGASQSPSGPRGSRSPGSAVLGWL